jgi:hypothetical protein
LTEGNYISGFERCDSVRLRRAGVLAAMILVFSSGLCRAKDKKGSANTVKVEGLLTEVQPAKITIQSGQGNPSALATSKDYSSELAAGLRVTVWYTPGQDSNLVQSVESPLDNFFTPPSGIEESIHKVIILPKSNVAGADGFLDAMEQYLKSHLNWYVPPRALAEEVKTIVERRSSLDAIDPNTGDVDMSKFVTGEGDLIKRIASETRVDGVLEVNIIQVPVEMDTGRGSVKWDGVEETLGSKMSRTLGKLSFAHTSAQVPATTAYLKLWDAQGNLLWMAHRGLFLLADESGGFGAKIEERSLAGALMDSAAVEQRLELLFGSLQSKTLSSSQR